MYQTVFVGPTSPAITSLPTGTKLTENLSGQYIEGATKVDGQNSQYLECKYNTICSLS